MFRFTIRDVLWLTVVVAIFVAGYVEWRAGDSWTGDATVQTIEKMKTELDAYRAVGIIPQTQKTPGRWAANHPW